MVEEIEANGHHFLSNNSMSNTSLKVNPIMCHKGKVNVDQLGIKTETITEDEQQPQLIFIKEEIKEELLYSDVPECVKEPTSFYYCNQCEYATDDKQNLTDHVLGHRFNVDGYSTRIQNSSYDSKSNGDHENVKVDKTICEPNNFTTRTNAQPLNCDKCDFKTRYKHSLKKQKETHTTDKQYKCNLCNFVSKYSRSLKVHLTKHSNEVPLSCDKCKYTTYFKWNLVQHKKKHSKEKHLKCNLCNYECNYLSNLKVHFLKHSEKRPFNCDKCEYNTLSKCSLMRHAGIHSDGKSFKCDLCDYSSDQAGNLKIHSIKHWCESFFKCEKCDYSTHDKRKFATHLRGHRRKIV